MSPRTSRIAAAMRPGVFAELQRHVDAFAARGGDLVPLHIGDTYVAPPVASERAVPAAEVASYGATPGLPELRASFAASLTARGLGPTHGIDPNAELVLGSGATHALSCVARAIFEPADEVLLLSPYWPLAHGILVGAGARVVEVPVPEEASELEARLRAAVTPRTRGVYVITPNNPDGRVLGEAELRAVARVAEERDLWVVADEVYADYTYDAPHLPFARISGMAQRTVSAFSLSKSHALAGARVGAVVAPAEVIALARRFSVHTVFNVPVPMQRVALEALAAPASWIDATRATYRAARDAATSALARAGIGHRPAAGGVYLFLDLRPVLAGRPLEALLARAIDEGVLLAPGASFGAAHTGFARLCYSAVPAPRVLEGIARLERAIAAF